MDVEEQPTEIDEGLYSRQLYVMGREGQARMAVSGTWRTQRSDRTTNPPIDRRRLAAPPRAWWRMARRRSPPPATRSARRRRRSTFGP